MRGPFGQRLHRFLVADQRPNRRRQVGQAAGQWRPPRSRAAVDAARWARRSGLARPGPSPARGQECPSGVRSTPGTAFRAPGLGHGRRYGRPPIRLQRGFRLGGSLTQPGPPADDDPGEVLQRQVAGPQRAPDRGAAVGPRRQVSPPRRRKRRRTNSSFRRLRLRAQWSTRNRLMRRSYRSAPSRFTIKPGRRTPLPPPPGA